MANTIEVILKFTDQASKGFKTTKEQLSGIGDVAKSVGGTLQTVGSKLSGFGNAMTVGITAPVVAAGIASIKMASDYEESLNKMRVVFKDAAPVVEEFSKTAASALGMSSQEALSAAGTFGNLFTAMGIGESVSANMSIQLIKLASDLASFNNISPTEALDKLRAGLVGEAEPLRSLGINLNQAQIEAKAVEMGLIELGGELTAAAKAQASYALIMEQTTAAQGDFARTSDGLANQTRIMSAQIKDAAVQLGENFLPIALKVIQTVNDMVTSFKNAPPGVQNAILAFVGIVAVAGPVISAIGGIISVVGTLTSFVGSIIPLLGSGGALATGLTTIGTLITGTVIPAMGGFISMLAASAGAYLVAIAPIALLVAAIGLLIFTIVKLGPTAWNTVQMLGTIISTWASNMIATIQRTAQQVWANIQQMWSNLVNSFNTFKANAFVLMANIGKAIVDGIWNGIQAGWEWLTNAVQELAQKLYQAVKDALGIESPSKVFEQGVGLNIAAGIGKGITRGMRSVKTSLANDLVGMSNIPGIKMGSPILSRAVAPAAAYSSATAPVSNGGTWIFNYSPGMSLGDRREMETQAAPFIRSALRRRG